MGKIIVEGLKLSTNPISTKVLYSKDGKHYIRTGADNFSKGDPIRQHVSSYFTKWGFRQMIDSRPEFYDGEELARNIDKFQPAPGYKVKYYG